MYNEILKTTISQIDEMYISNKFCQLVDYQSCDCDEIIIKSKEKLIYFTIKKSGEDWYIDFQEINEIDQSKYVYKVDLSKERYEFDKILYLDNGKIDGIRFIYNNTYFFIFALEHNLVLTKSKCNLFFDEPTDVYQDEPKLTIYKLR